MRAFSHNVAAWDPVRPEFRVRMRQRADRRMSCSPLARQDKTRNCEPHTKARPHWLVPSTVAVAIHFGIL